MDTLYLGQIHGFGRVAVATEPTFNEDSLVSLLIVLGSSLSLVALIFAFITHSLFSDLRKLAGTSLLNLIAALFMTQLLYVIGVGGVTDRLLCVSLALSMLYMRLCVFCWLLVMVHHTLVNFRPAQEPLPAETRPEATSTWKSFLRYSTFAWGAPILVLCANVYLLHNDKAKNVTLDLSDIKENNCWFLEKNVFIFGFLVPASLLAAAIFACLVRSAVVSRYVISMQVDKRIRDKMQKRRRLQISLLTKISVVLIFVVLLGAASKFTRSESVWIAFHTGQGLQGLIVAALVTCNCHVLKLYTKGSRFKDHLGGGSRLVIAAKNLVKGGDSSRSSSLQLLSWDPNPDPV